jgi:RNA polymerase sigma-70 factor, ECF subfamily
MVTYEHNRMPIADTPLTRLTLIGALRQGLRWEEFVALYGRLILLWGRRDFGLQAADAENVCQEVLLRVWKSIAHYDAGRGRFRNWLYVCTRNAVLDLRRRQRSQLAAVVLPDVPEGPRPGQADRPAWQQLPEEADLERAVQLLDEEGFDLDDLQAVVVQVRERVQPATWKAFLMFEFLELKAREIGPRLGMKPAAVNQAVHRVRQLLQQALAARRGDAP